MRLPITYSTWISLLALAALLVSGFVSASVGMNASMQHRVFQPYTSAASLCADVPPASSANHDAMRHNMPNQHSGSASDHHQTNPCDVSNNMDMSGHSCCDTTCTNVPAVLSQSAALSLLASYIIVAPGTATGDIVQRIQTPYRPPIA